MRKNGSDMYGVSLEKKIEKIIDQFFSSGTNQLKINDIIHRLHAMNDFNFYRRVLTAIKNIEQEKKIVLVKQYQGDHRLPTYIITPCLESSK